jgi:hypothetical protein
MDDDDAISALFGLPVTVRPDPAQLAAMGATASEIAAVLAIPTRDAAVQAGDVTPAQLRRIEQTLVDRAVGGEYAPHVQASQYLLGAHLPMVYGRQAAQSGNTTINVIVNRGRALAGRTIDGEVLSLPVLDSTSQ